MLSLSGIRGQSKSKNKQTSLAINVSVFYLINNDLHTFPNFFVAGQHAPIGEAQVCSTQ